MFKEPSRESKKTIKEPLEIFENPKGFLRFPKVPQSTSSFQKVPKKLACSLMSK